MKCPNCGEEMAEGSLYCEHCGEDIHIVPDFEPELEKSIAKTMELAISEILEELGRKDPFAPEENDPSEEEDPSDSGSDNADGGSGKLSFQERLLWKFLSGLLFAVIIGAVFMGVWAYQYHSVEYQTARAVQCVSEGNYDRAIACYNRAIELDREDIELLFSLAEVYFLKNNKIEYEYLLREIVKNEGATLEQLDRAYGKLIAIYRARGDYQTINDLLQASQDQELIATYRNYIAQAPEFSLTEGYYTGIQPLKLTASGSGKVYYTLDGSDPDASATPYTTPILLEDGDYLVKAVFINDNGVPSEIVSKEYHVENDEIPAPEISAVSGEYEFPISIEVLDDNDEVYYTTDGSDPTYSSSIYSGPIPMPLGKTVFKFAKIEDGVVGDIAERTYYLQLHTEYTPEQAAADVAAYALETGKILDAEGHFDESGDMYKYVYQYVTHIRDADDSYIIAEIYQAADGTLTRTGNNYAVNAYTGERFRLQRDERGRTSLVELEIREDSQEGE